MWALEEVRFIIWKMTAAIRNEQFLQDLWCVEIGVGLNRVEILIEQALCLMNGKDPPTSLNFNIPQVQFLFILPSSAFL